MNLLITIILFSQLTTPYETRIFLDADGEFLIYARYYQGSLVSIDSIKSLADYFTSGLQLHNLNLLSAELKKDMTKQGGYANKGIFGTVEIPLPKGGFSEFMGETGKLDVGGYVKITLGGSETFLSNVSGQESPSFLPELEMKQEMAINLDGQVGDRMKVYIDHNSERINETQNKIRVTYLGREDDIIQEIEGGDTQLSIPATNYTGDIPSHSGLFGVKSTAKVGPVDLVAIASNEQTQTQETEFEGSIQADTASIWDKYYERRRFFWLGTYDSIISLQVYVDDNNALNNNQGVITYFGNAYLDTNDNNIPDDTINPTNHKPGYFTKKDQGLSYFYIFVPGDNIVELNSNLANQQVLGVYYVKKNSFGTIDTVGRLPLAASDTIQLKLICPGQADTTSETWNYEKRNYYQLVSPGSRLDSLRIYYVTSGGERKDRQGDVPYIEVLGLDSLPKDGMIDENRVWFPSRGLLIFPDSLPFASNRLDDPDLEIYQNPYMINQGKYYIHTKTIEAKPVFTLPENVIKVTVYVDDVVQDSIRDYHVDYEGGKLEFKKTLAPTSKIRIKSEYAPFFSASQKSLFGLRGTSNPFGDAALGSSFFYRTESYPAEHVRLREEPFNRMVWEVDFSLPQTMPLVTKFVDWLPLVETEAESKLNLNFEGAYSFSNLNSRGQVWLDDLESSTIITNDISISKTFLVLASKPIGRDTTNFMKQRLIWYNPIDTDRLQTKDIYVTPQDPDQIADVLKIIFRPENTLSFGGLTQYIYSENFDEVENLEFILKGRGGRIHIEFAQEIDEDQLRRNKNGVLVGMGTKQDEDQHPANGTWNDLNEDTGLDTVYGADSLDVSGDDGNDDYKDKDYTSGINGTEHNGSWDTEDIDHNGVLNSENRYYSYSVDLDSAKFLIENAGLKQGWKMFRMPIKDSLVWDTVINQPDWHNIRYVRIWFDDFANAETLLVYRLGVSGSRWKNYGIKGKPLAFDTTDNYLENFTITPVNTQTHSYYKPPYPLETDPLTGQVKSEGALECRLENIEEGHTCVAHRTTEDYEDYRAYDTLSFYLNAHHSNPLISIRIGSDSLNYYEYATEYENGQKKGINDYRLFFVSLQHFTNLKSRRQGNEIISDSGYTVVGNPSLAVNQFLELRIENQLTTRLTDTIWFDDVKLVSPKTEVGRILRGNGSFNFADLASVSFSYNESNGKFRRLTESKDMSTHSADRNYGTTASISFDKFLPESWGFDIPVGLNYNKSMQEPRYSYLANDLEISGLEQEEQRSTSIGKSYTLHIAKSNSKNWFLKQTLDRLSFDHSRGNNYSQSALNCDTSQAISYSGNYSLDPKLSFKVSNQSFSVLPQNLAFSANYNDNLARSYYRTSPDSIFKQSAYSSSHRTLSSSVSASYSPHSIINTRFDFSQDRDSVSEKRRFGEEVRRRQTFDASLSKDLKIISPRLTCNSSYDEDHRFEIRQDQDFRNVSNSLRYGVSSSINIRDMVKFFTSLRDETKDTLQPAGSPAWFTEQIESFIERIQNPVINYSKYRYSSYLNAKTRPDAKYQWGLVDSIPPEDIAPGSFPGRGTTAAYGVTSGLDYRFLNIMGGYNGQITRTFNYSGGEQKTNNVSYPNATLRLLRLEAMPLLKKYSRSSSINSGFNQTVEQRYDVLADSATLVSDSKTISLSPLISWQSTWVKGISTTIDVTYSETNSNSYSGSPGVPPVPSRTLGRGGSFALGYTFSAPRGLRLPFLGGLKFTSNLTLNWAINYNRNTSYALNLTSPTNDTRTLGTNIGLTYNFSSSITGGANFDYSQNKEMNSSQDSKRVGLNLWTNINF